MVEVYRDLAECSAYHQLFQISKTTSVNTVGFIAFACNLSVFFFFLSLFQANLDGLTKAALSNFLNLLS